MTFCEIAESVFILFLILTVAYSWYWCTKNPESCKYWEQERRQVDQPILFPCRRANHTKYGETNSEKNV